LFTGGEKPHLLVEFETAEAVYNLLFLFSYTMMNHGVYSNYIVEQTPQFIVV